MSDFATATTASALPYVLPLLFAMLRGATISPSARQPQPEQPAVQLFKPTESSLSDSRPEAQRYATSQSSAWAESALEKIGTYAGTSDGWRGEGSHAPSGQTLKESAKLLLQISAEMPDLLSPLISMDDDGFACLHWQGAEFLSTIYVFGDGTYSFFSEGYGIIARSDSEEVGAILPKELIASMTGQIPFESAIAA